MLQNSWWRAVKAFLIGWAISLFIWEIITEFAVKSHLESLGMDFTALTLLPILLIGVILSGFIFGTIQYFIEKYIEPRVSFRGLLIRGIVIHLLGMLVIYLCIYILLRITGLDHNLLFIDFLTDSIILVNLIYSILTNFAIIICIQVNRLLGKGNLMKMITGKFHQPREEFRVFMFLDLKSSTSIAESLGHKRYSRFIQDCYFDLFVIEKFKAEVYQYVGDEVVLTWKINKGDTIDHCLQTYFAYMNQLQSKSSYYTQNYDVIPMFKAGVDLGMVTVVEVGSVKREIAYHGDTLNTASRILEQNKSYNTNLLISGNVFNYLKNTTLFDLKHLEDLQLRGKEAYTSLYSVLKK